MTFIVFLLGAVIVFAMFTLLCHIVPAAKCPVCGRMIPFQSMHTSMLRSHTVPGTKRECIGHHAEISHSR